MNSTLGFSAPASAKKKMRKAAAQRGRSNRVQKSSEKNAESQNDSGHPEVVSDQTVAIPKVIDGYKIIRCLGKGGMGVVYEAHDSRLNRKVALKVLKAGQDAEVDVILRFRREAEHVARLRHPHIVSIFDIGTFEYQDYFTMDLIKGVTFDEWIRKERPTIKQRVGVIQKVAEAIHYAHGMKIIHRDLKPENILIDEEGEPHVMDFGLARNVSVSSRLTITGMTLGTPNYMSPEQAKAKKNVIGPCSDVWSLGVVLYESLSGRPPFWAENIYATLISVINDSPEPLRKLDRKIPKNLETICMKCLEKNRFKRYSTAQSLAEDLGAWISGDLIQARPPSVAERAVRLIKAHPLKSVSCLLLLVFSAVGGFLYHEKREAEWAMNEQERLAPVKRAAERKRALAASKNKADRDASEALAMLKSARKQLANGQKREATTLLIDAQALYTSVLHEIPEHNEARAGVGEVVKMQFQMVLTERNWEHAKDYLLRGVKAGLDEAELSHLRSKLNVAQAAERATIRKKVRDLMMDSILGDDRKTLQTAAESKLRNLPQKFVIFELLRYISSEHMEQQLLAINVLGGIGNIQVAKKLLPFIQKVSPSGSRTEYPVKVATFNSICQIAPIDNDIYSELRLQLQKLSTGDEHREFKNDTRVFRNSYFLKMKSTQNEKSSIRLIESGMQANSGQANVLESNKNLQVELKDSSIRKTGLIDGFGDEIIGDELKFVIKRVNEMLNNDPDDPLALHYRGILRERDGDMEGALSDYSKSIQLAPDVVKGYTRRGILYEKMRNFNMALSDFTKAINLDPESTANYMHRGKVQMLSGRTEVALRDYNMAIRLSPRNAFAWNGRGDVRLKMGRYEAAISDFIKALAILPTLKTCYYNLARAYAGLGEVDKASEKFARAISLSPDKAKYRNQRAKFRLTIKNFVGALQDTAHALKSEPENGRSWMLQGQAHVALGDFKTALEDFSNSIHFASAEDMPYQGRGKLYQKTGRYLEAITDLKKAVSLNNKNWKSHLYLGISLNFLGKKIEAKRSMDTAMALSPDAQEYYDSIKATLKNEAALNTVRTSEGDRPDTLKK